MEARSEAVTIASRIDRLPIFSLHRRLMVVLGIGTFFDLYDIFLGGVLGPRSTGRSLETVAR